MKRFALLIFSFLFLLIAPIFSVLASNCHGQMINLAAINWRGMFPITIGSSNVVSGDLPDTRNPGNPFCMCKDGIIPKFGVAMGFWEPMGLVDVTRTPYCLVNLGGQQIASGNEGSVETPTAEQHGAFYYVHYYNFPILQFFGGWLLRGRCHTDGAFIPYYFSELDPTWHDDIAARDVFPETWMFADPTIALGLQIACTGDSFDANTHLPDDTTFWCAGSQGLMFPMDGEVAEVIGPAQATTLIAERAAFKLHQLGFIPDTSPDDLCSEHHDINLPKSRYRYEMVYPSYRTVEPFGRDTQFWAGGVYGPTQSDDSGYLIWRKRNCCNY